MATIFGNVRLDGWQFRDLMTTRIADVIAGAQRLLAVTTRRGHEIHERVHARRGNHGPRVSRMPRLPTGLPATLRAAPPDALLAGQSIG